MSPDQLSTTFAALADPTRRAILALQADPLKAAAGWIEDYRHHWEQRLDRLDEYLQTLQAKEQPP